MDGGRSDDNCLLPTAYCLLDNLRVLDLADESGFLCGRILADLGADVLKVEPPDGDLGRTAPPFADDRAEPDRSLTWLAGNVNKRGITCNLEVESGRALFRRLAERADVVITTFTPEQLQRRGLDYDSLSSIDPRLVLTTITPFGADGPLADCPGSDLVATAAGGALWLAGDPDGPPVRGTLPMSPAWTGMYAAVGTLLAVLARDATGRGQHVDTSAQASMVTAISHAPLFWDLLGEDPKRSGPFLSGRSVTGARFRNVWPCKDGYVTFALYGGPAGRHTSKALVVWMAERGAARAALAAVDWDRFDVATATQEVVDALEDEIAPFLLGLTKAEFFEGVIGRNMLGYPVADTEDIRRDEQLEARNFWQQVEAPWGGSTLTFPGSFALFDGARPPIRRGAPGVGEHNVEVYVGELGLTTHELVALRGAGAV